MDGNPSALSFESEEQKFFPPSFFNALCKPGVENSPHTLQKYAPSKLWQLRGNRSCSLEVTKKGLPFVCLCLISSQAHFKVRLKEGEYVNFLLRTFLLGMAGSQPETVRTKACALPFPGAHPMEATTGPSPITRGISAPFCNASELHMGTQGTWPLGRALPPLQ